MRASPKDKQHGGQSEDGADPKAGQKRVLVVDDEVSIAETLTAIFRSAGYEAVAAYDAKSAIEKCFVFHPDLVLSDVMMPGMNGVEMAIVIQQVHPHSRVILFSGQAETHDLMAKARENGYEFELLTKPISPEELLEKVGAYR
ncbi:MAG TPA: response regulator [Candidatus Angelobacter sp.]|nr:response regulator [Candidatus Angelobacter sp.]